MTLASVFQDHDVAQAYRYRAPYPDETFAILQRLLVGPGDVLDIGAGSGALARPMAHFARRVDAVDPSGASLHWMDHDRVMPRFERVLSPGARLAIIETDDGEHPLPGVLDIIRRYSELSHHRDLPELVADLEAGGWFVREGEERTAPTAFRRSVEEYLQFLHSTSTLARVRLGARSTAFDTEIRDLFARHKMTTIERQVVGVVVYGRPVSR